MKLFFLLILIPFLHCKKEDKKLYIKEKKEMKINLTDQSFLLPDDKLKTLLKEKEWTEVTQDEEAFVTMNCGILPRKVLFDGKFIVWKKEESAEKFEILGYKQENEILILKTGREKSGELYPVSYAYVTEYEIADWTFHDETSQYVTRDKEKTLNRQKKETCKE